MEKNSLKVTNERSEKRLLFSGVLILTIANILGKIFGFLYKVPLNSILGDEMANVNSAYAIYTTLYMISTAGIPVAVSVLISESRAKKNRKRLYGIYNTALTFLSLIGFLGTLIMIFTAGPISRGNSDGDSFLCLCAIAPALLFIAISSVYRGYFQGFGIMTPTAVSQIIESFGKMVIGLLGAYLAINRFGLDKNIAAAITISGMTLSIGLGCLYLVFAKRYYEKKGMLKVEAGDSQNEEELKRKELLFRIVEIALPIALTSAVLSLASLIDAQLMRPLLARFYGDAEYAKALYSDYSTGAVTMFNMPIVLISPIACAIVPFISSAVAKQRTGEAKSLMSTALRMTSIIAMPCALGLCALASPILTLVFRGDSDMAQNAGDLLSVLAISVFFVGMLSVTNAVLQANRLEKKPIISMLFGILVKVSASFFLIGKFGEIGAPLSTLLFYITVVTFNFIFVIKNLGIKVNFAFTFIRPLSASLICALTALGVYRLLFTRLGLTLSTLIAICAAVLIYAISIFLFKCITKEDIAVLPKGERIGKILTKMKLI